MYVLLNNTATNIRNKIELPHSPAELFPKNARKSVWILENALKMMEIDGKMK